MAALRWGISFVLSHPHDSLVAQLVKNPPAMQETPIRSLGQDGPLEKEMAPHQYSYLGNSMDRAWWATVHGVAESEMA